MFFNRDTVTALILAASTLGGLRASAAPTRGAAELEAREPPSLGPRYDGVSYVYRADKRSPAEIQKAQGMWAKGYSPGGSKLPPDVSLYNHVKGATGSFMSQGNDGYVSFSSSRSLAESWVDKYLGSEGYVYEVHAYPNLIDVQQTLKHYNVYPEEKEFAAIRGVDFDQIKGWNQYRAAKDKKGTYSVKQAYVANKQYDQKRFSQKEHGGAQYALAGFPRGHKAWKEDPWYFYAACALHKRGSTTPSKDSSSAKGTCGPAKTNQQYAQEYADAIDADKKFNPKKTHT